MADMSERCRISVQTLQRVEKGDPTVSFGVYAMCLHILGISKDLDKLGAPELDELGNLLVEKDLPERIRKRTARPPS